MISTSPVRSCWFLPISFIVTSSGEGEDSKSRLLSQPHLCDQAQDISAYFCSAQTSNKMRFENMLRATWGGGDKT